MADAAGWTDVDNCLDQPEEEIDDINPDDQQLADDLFLQDWQNDIENRKREEGAATPMLHHDSPYCTPRASPRGVTGFAWIRRPTLTDWEEAELRPQWTQTQSKGSRPSVDLTSFSFLDSPPPPPIARSNKRKEKSTPQSPPKRPRTPDTPLHPLPPQTNQRWSQTRK